MAYTTDLNAELVSKQASKNTKMLFEYLKSIYGKKTSGRSAVSAR